MFTRQVSKVHDRRAFRARRAQRQACELAHESGFVEEFFHGRIAQGEPVLQKINTQHGLQRAGLWSLLAFGENDMISSSKAGHIHAIIRVFRLIQSEYANP